MVRNVLKSIVLPAFVALVVSAPTVARAQTPAADPTAAFFDNTVLHDIHFTMNSKDWQTLKDNYLDNTYYPADFRWGTTTVRNSGIRSRGLGSRSGAKPGLRLDFDRYTSSQKFLGLKSLVLRNSTQDPSNMHEQVAMLLFRRLGMVASREIYARLFVNNQYAGLYSIVESVDKGFVANHFGSDTGFLYKYDYNVAEPAYYFTYRTSAPADYVPSPFKPETREGDSEPQVLERFAWTVNNATEAAFRGAIAEFIDVLDLIRHVASEAFIADNDGFVGNWGMNNYYLYRLTDSHQFKFIKWDKSEAFKDGPTYSIWHNHLDVPDTIRNRLWSRVMSYPDLKTFYLDFLLICAESAMQVPEGSAANDTRGWMEREIDRQQALIQAAVHTDPTKPYTNEQFEEAVNVMRDFARRRADVIKGQVAASR